MRPGPIKITRTVEVAVVDADGKAIHLGSVLECLTPEAKGRTCDRGVVVEIAEKQGQQLRHNPFPAIGDLTIKTGPGCYRCTNVYGEWRHIPREKQTRRERLEAWLATPSAPADFGTNAAEITERMGIAAILSLLPEDVLADENRDWPNTIEEALDILVCDIEGPE
jgi:hypothetical protein